MKAECPIRNWRPEVGNTVGSGYDYEAGIVCRNPNLMWFHIARSEGFFATDAERLDVCLSDTSYVEEADRIPRQPAQHIPPGSNPGEEHQSDIEDSSGPSSSESEEENPAAEQSKDSDNNEDQSGDEGGNCGDPALEVNVDDLLFQARFS